MKETIVLSARDMMVSNLVFLSDNIQKKNNNECVSGLAINDKSDIFCEHFPGLPTLPSAITLSLAMDVGNKLLNDNHLFEYLFSKVEGFSFVKRINPSENKNLILDVAYKFNDSGELLLTVNIRDGNNSIYARGKLIYKKSRRSI